MMRFQLSLRRIQNNEVNCVPHRLFHATRRQEILPLVGAVFVFMTIRYSYKALQRMDEEWDEYQWLLQQYEKKHGGRDATKPQNTMGIDLGSFYMKLALFKDKPSILVNRQGYRSTFNGILYPDDENRLLGQQAFDKLYELPISSPQKHQVVLPAQSPQVTSLVLLPAIQEALEVALGSSVLEQVRPVVAVPSTIQDCSVYDFLPQPTYVMEPVATIWGAQQVLGMENHGGPILVLDVGATVTCLAVVAKDKILKSITVPVGGESWPRVIVQYLLDSHKDLKIEGDGMAVQRLQQAAHIATMEFNVNSRAYINIPYISMDLKTREPEHLDTNVSRRVVEQLLQEDLAKTDIPAAVLSSLMPKPTNFESLWMSLVTQILLETDMTPMTLERILLVGGGAKQVLVEQSFRDAITALTGGSNPDLLLVPEVAIRSELVALGAASLSPKHEYTMEAGLRSK